jgi:large subunit ribosomal protein L22
MIQTRAYLKSIRLSPIKAGLVADAVRGKHVQEALYFLNFRKKNASAIVKKLIESAISNA